MAAPRRYPEELRERAMRLVAEAGEEDPELSLNAAMKSTSHKRVRARRGEVAFAQVRRTLLDAGAVASIGTVADSYDNAQAETLIGLYKVECVRHDGPMRGLDDLELATCESVHSYNTHRLHGSIGHVPPIEYENEYYRRMNDQSITHELPLV